MNEPLPEFLRLLAHDVRWNVLRLLASGDYRVNELVAHVEQPMNLVSYHLKKLREDDIVQMRRSEADGRDTYYSLDLDRLRDLYRAAGRALHPSLAAPADQPVRVAGSPRVLFVCTHNSARSQMAEGLLRHLSQGRVSVTSAGSEPTQIHPDAIRTMQALGIDIRGQQSRGLESVTGSAFDYVITVCDRAREICPAFPGEGQQFHWGFADPTRIDDAAQRQQAFAATAQRLKTRIEHFLYAAGFHE